MTERQTASRAAQVEASLAATGMEELALSATADRASHQKRETGSGLVGATELTPGAAVKIIPQIRGH